MAADPGKMLDAPIGLRPIVAHPATLASPPLRVLTVVTRGRGIRGQREIQIAARAKGGMPVGRSGPRAPLKVAAAHDLVLLRGLHASTIVAHAPRVLLIAILFRRVHP